MPMYEYRCECNKEREVRLSLQDADQPQICECGKVMQKQMSLSSFRMRQVANDMALATLNAPKGKGMPNRHWKPDAERKAFAGTQSRPRTIW